jgi:prepilin-type N-terminal cleavage/methylation domain-containing protein
MEIVMHDCTRRRGFTLMELLVVMVIISLLVSMLAPALVIARERARRIKAAAEVRTLETAWRSYYQTYEVLPAGKTAMTAVNTAMLAGDDVGMGNASKIVFMEFSDTALQYGFEDPWKKKRNPGKHLYQLEFSNNKIVTKWTFQTRVHCVNHNRGKF